MPILDMEPGTSPEAPGVLRFYAQGAGEDSGVVLHTDGQLELAGALDAAGDLTVTGTLTALGYFGAGGNVGLGSAASDIGFYGATPAARPDVTGSRTDGSALASLLTALDTLGLITDSSTA